MKAVLIVGIIELIIIVLMLFQGRKVVAWLGKQQAERVIVWLAISAVLALVAYMYSIDPASWSGR